MRNLATKRRHDAAFLGLASWVLGHRCTLIGTEGDGSAAGGSTGTETTTTTTSTPGEPAPAPGGSSEKMLPQSQVNTLIATAKREARDAALREQQQAPAKKTEAAQPKSADDRLASLEAELAETKQRSAFDKSAAKLGISDDDATDLFDLAKVQKPENLSEWLEKKAARLTKSASTTTTTTAPITAATTEPVVPPATAPGAPIKVDPITSAGLVDIFNLTDAQIAQLGPAGMRTEFEKIKAVGMQQAGAPPRPKLPQR